MSVKFKLLSEEVIVSNNESANKASEFIDDKTIHSCINDSKGDLEMSVKTKKSRTECPKPTNFCK